MLLQGKNPDIENRFRNELENHSIKFLKFSIIMVSVLFAVLFVFNNIITVQQFRGTNLVYVILSLFSISLIFTVYKGYQRFSAYTLVFLVWSALIFFIWNGGKIFDLSNFALLVLILFTAVLINRNTAIIVALLSLANYWLIISTTHEDYISPAISTINMGRDFTVIMVTTILIVFIYENTLRNSLYQIAGLLYQNELDQAKILKTEQSYREIFESIDDAIFILDSITGKIFEFNQAACSMFGYTKSELAKMTVLQLSAIEEGYNKELSDKKLKEVLEKGSLNYEWRLRRNGGELFWADIKIKSSVIGGENRIITIVRDITDQKVVSELINASEEHFRTIISNIPGAVYRCEVDVPWKTLYFSHDILYISGYSSDEFVSGEYSFGNLMLTEDRKKCNEIVQKAIQNKSDFSLEYRIRHRDGTIRWIFEKGKVHYSETGIADWLDGVMLDITEQKNTAEAHQKITSLHSAILENAGYAIITTDVSGIITSFNRAAEILLDFDACELIGQESPVQFHDTNEIKNQAEYLSTKYNEKIEEGFEVFVYEAKKGIAEEYEWTYIRKDGYRFPILLKITALYDGELNLSGFLGISADISQRKQTEESLRISEERLKASLEYTPNVAIQWYDINGCVLYWNRASELFYGYTSAEALRKPLNKLIYSDKEFEDFLNFLNQIDKTGIPIGPFESTCVHKNGSIRNIIATRFVIPGINKEKVFVCMDIDITEKKIIEKELINERFLLRTLIDTLPINLYIKDLESKFVLVNKPIIKLLGKTQEKILGKNDYDFFETDKANEFYTDEQNLYKTGNPIISKQEYMHDSMGKEVYMITSKLPIYNSDGIITGLVGSGLEITERVNAENEIKALNESLERKVLERTYQLEKANKDLEAFAYSVSHDLRAPLRHVDGFLKIMYSNISNPTDTISHYYQKIEQASHRMSNMIDDLLTFSRLGRKELTLSEVDLNKIISEIIENYTPEITNRNIKYKIASLPKINADKGLIKLIFENLISNAIKYTSKISNAKIEIGIEKQNKSLVEIFVKDNGAGFDMAYAHKLFGVFQRLHTHDEFEGTGIGLANVKQIVNKHKGSVRAEGKVNEGSTFYIALPIKN